MPTNNPRINVTFEAETAKQLASIASQESKSISSLVRELAAEALEMREDLYFSKLAAGLDTENARILPHEQAWK